MRSFKARPYKENVCTHDHSTHMYRFPHMSQMAEMSEAAHNKKKMKHVHELAAVGDISDMKLITIRAEYSKHGFPTFSYSSLVFLYFQTVDIVT